MDPPYLATSMYTQVTSTTPIIYATGGTILMIIACRMYMSFNRALPQVEASINMSPNEMELMDYTRIPDADEEWNSFDESIV